MELNQIIAGIETGDFRMLARAITIVENDLELSSVILAGLRSYDSTPVLGITGAPGAGKSTLVNALLKYYIEDGKKVAVLAVDPTSPFTKGSLLGDRVRMLSYFNADQVYIRSIATRGSLGGLSNKANEVIAILEASNFDIIIVETVGVGQSEVDIVKFADQILVVLVPDGGDDIQHVKSGIMEIADAFIVNKADRENTGKFVVSLKTVLHDQVELKPVFETVADADRGVEELYQWLGLRKEGSKERVQLLADKAIDIISKNLVAQINRDKIVEDLELAVKDPAFNIYTYCSIYTNSVSKSRL